MSSSKPVVDLLTLTGIAPSSVSAHRFVGFDDAQASVAGQKIKGVARSDAASGAAYPIGVKGTDIIETGGAFSIGDDVISDASGRAVKASASGPAAVTAITKANPGVVTAVGHGFSTGDVVTFTDVGGMVELNQNSYAITVLTADTFSIGINTTSLTTYTSGGSAHRVGPRQHVGGTALEASSGSGKFVEILR